MKRSTNRAGWVTRYDEVPPAAEVKPLAAEAVKVMIDTTVNGAVAKMKSEFTGMVTSAIEPIRTEFTALTTTISTLSERLGGGIPPPAGGAPPPASILPPEINAQLKDLKTTTTTLQNELKTERDRRENAEKATAALALDNGVRTALGDFVFASPSAAEDAFALIRGRVASDDQGNLIAGDLPLKNFLADFIPNQKAYLLAPTGRSGAGASSGAPGGRPSTFQMESIKTGMSSDDQKKALAAINSVLANR